MSTMTNPIASSPTALAAVRVHNAGDSDYTDMYAGQTYTIAAGSDGFVPFDAVCLWLGDPRTQDLGPRDKHRTDEFLRVALRMGVGEKPMDVFEAARPKLEVFNPQTGDRLVTVADDPTGPGQDVFKTGGNEADPTVRLARVERALAEIAKNGDKGGIADVLAELGIGDVNAPVEPAPVAAKVEVPVDEPAKPAVSRRRS
jgi:hypothetical protein